MEEMSWMMLATVSGLAIAILVLVGALRFADAARKGNRRFKWMSRLNRSDRAGPAPVPSPDGAYTEPADVLTAHGISNREKMRLLEQWRYDVVQVQVGANEGLTGEGSGSADASLLSRIDRALATLGGPQGSRARSAGG